MMKQLETSFTLDENDSWEILSTTSLTSINSCHSFEEVKFSDAEDRGLSHGISFKDALLSSVQATGSFRLSSKRTTLSPPQQIIALSPKLPQKAKYGQNELVQEEPSENWGFTTWMLQKKSVENVRTIRDATRKARRGAGKA